MREGAGRRGGRSGAHRRSVDTSALSAGLTVVAIAPVWLLALGVFWLPVGAAWHVPYAAFAAAYLALGLLLFLRPVQLLILAPLLGARRPTRDERAVLDTAWRSVTQASRQRADRYVVLVQPAGELNAFACGGHLVVVTSFAVDTLPRDELAGVLAHELSHHLGFHTVALTIGHWLSVPVLVLARVGFFLRSVAAAATASYARHSSALTALGRLVAGILTAISWVFLSGLLLSTAIGNLVGRTAELEADRRVVAMGFGRPLASALRRVAAAGGQRRPTTFAERLAATHPAPLTRITHIEAILRRR